MKAIQIKKHQVAAIEAKGTVSQSLQQADGCP